MFITKLDIVNDCLKTMGETKLNTLEDDHSYKDDALDIIDRVVADVCALKLWFNVELLELRPDADSKYIYIPQDVLKVEPRSRYNQGLLAVRGRRLYDAHHNKYEFDRSVKAIVARLIPFDDCPYEAQQFVRDETVLRFQRDFDGDNTKYTKLQYSQQQSWILLKSEHIRQIKSNPLYERPAVRVLGERYFNYSGHPWHSHTTFPG